MGIPYRRDARGSGLVRQLSGLGLPVFKRKSSGPTFHLSANEINRFQFPGDETAALI